MNKEDLIQAVFKNGGHPLSLFSKGDIGALKKKALVKSARGQKALFVRCAVRDKDIQLKPEEAVRQLYAMRLIRQYGYPKKRLAFEHSVNFGREAKSADIVIFDKDRPEAPYIIVELKQPKLKDGKRQLRSYCNAAGAAIGVWTNGAQISYYHRKDPNYFENITDIPKAAQSLKDLLSERFTFDALMANPPFAGDIKESRILHQYELGFKPNKKTQTQVGRDILFIERNLDFLRPGGRMAIVLPQGRFNNSSDERIREFIFKRARILAVVGLHSNIFKPHTGTKTSVLFVQKWNDDPKQGPLCPRKEDYPIFFAVSDLAGKDNSGNYIYLKNGDNGHYKLDKSGYMIVRHDLHSHGGELPEGIAEAFIKWAKREKLSFWR